MIYSMTGFAAKSQEIAGGILSIEFRAVNHRYLDLQIRLPEELKSQELIFREFLTKQLNRGKIDCKINYQPSPEFQAKLILNRPLLNQLIQLNIQLEKEAHLNPTPLSAHEILKWPGMLMAQSIDEEILKIESLKLLELALNEFNETRAREGLKLKAFILERIIQIETLISTLHPKLNDIIHQWQMRLKTRLNEALEHKADEERLKQEFVLFAQRIDIEEEIGRLMSHVNEIRHSLEQGGLVGKKLDFFMQELNREANTLGSKSVSIETTNISVELKVLIEQMREQIQNIE